MGAVFRWIKYIYEWVKNYVSGGFNAYLKGLLGYPIVYHVSKTGADTNSGLSWSKAFETIQAGLDAVGALGDRGKGIVVVGPGGYEENLITPLNSGSTAGPFGQLLAVNPTGESRGAVWLSSPEVDEPILTIRARGWKIDGFEFDSPTTDGCILLDGVTEDSDPRFTEIVNCLFNGALSANDFGIAANVASPFVVIKNCKFYAFGGEAITSIAAIPLYWEIANCWFEDNQKHIAPRASVGADAIWIHDCNFRRFGAHYTADPQIDMRNATQSHIGPNNFLGGTYDEAGGYFDSGSGFWYGNACEDGYSTALPA